MTSIRTGNKRRRRAQVRACEARFGFTIVDCRPVAARNPYSFYTPCQARLDAVTVEDMVKIKFEPTVSGPYQCTEAMWVLVDRVDGDVLHGLLTNEPISRMGIHWGGPVEFPRHAIINIRTERADDPEETNVMDDSVFHRCLMDERIYRGTTPVVRIVRDEPQPADYADERFPWSGWRFEAEGFEPGMPVEIGTPVISLRSFESTAVRDSFAQVLKAPAGAVAELVGDEWKLAA